MQRYPLGHSMHETRRLERQAEFLSSMTRDFLLAAGLREGMRVLDVGCGTGDVSFVASDIVGPSGHVLGIDNNAEAVERANARALSMGVEGASFAQGDLGGPIPSEKFDAIVGRLILMYAPEPSATLVKLSSLLAPGGILAFQEIDLSSARTVPPVPAFEEGLVRIRAAFSAAGAEPTMGLHLDRVYRDAGLHPELHGASRLEGHGEGFSPSWVAHTVRSLMPVILGRGIATESEVDVDTLEDRIRAGAKSMRSMVLGPLMVGAWAKVE